MCFTTVSPNENAICYGWEDYFPVNSLPAYVLGGNPLVNSTNLISANKIK
jgi:hypothetical protein